jgi:hypothetical protein
VTPLDRRLPPFDLSRRTARIASASHLLCRHEESRVMSQIIPFAFAVLLATAAMHLSVAVAASAGVRAERRRRSASPIGFLLSIDSTARSVVPAAR